MQWLICFVLGDNVTNCENININKLFIIKGTAYIQCERPILQSLLYVLHAYKYED